MPGLTFRTQALEKLTSPEQLDQLIRVTTLRGWLALAGLIILLAPLLGWGLWGSLETRVEAQGLLLPTGGLCVAPSPDDGLVSEVLVRFGQNIKPDQAVIRIQPAEAGSPPRDVLSLCNGSVAALLVRAGDPVQRGMGLLMVEPAGEALEAVAYFPFDEVYNITPGMAARIAPAGVETEVYGYLLGQVSSVGQYPISPQTLARQVGSQSLAESLLGSNALVDVHIRLANQAGVFQWSLDRQPDRPLTSGTPCLVSILLERRAPIELLFPRKP